MPSPNSPRQNHLLAALPAEVYERLLPQLEITPMPLGWAVYEPGDHMEKVYFPTTCIVSLLHIMNDGKPAEIALVGNDGALGIALFMGNAITPTRAVVQSAGHAYMIGSDALRDEFHLGGPLQQLLLHYTQALISQMTQTAVCNRHHSVEQQLTRWLLLSLDRLSTNKLLMTQRLIANMLGTRQGAIETLEKMETDGLIEYDRGCITVPDRKKLEERVCECYAVVRTEFDRLLPRNPNLLGAGSPRATKRGTQSDRRMRVRRICAVSSGAPTRRRAPSDRRGRRIGTASASAPMLWRPPPDRRGRRMGDTR